MSLSKTRRCVVCAVELDSDHHGGNFCSFACVDVWVDENTHTWIKNDMAASGVPVHTITEEGREVDG